MTISLKIGLIGCGKISNCHLIAIFENSQNSELVAICDKNQNNVKNFLEEFENQRKKYNYSKKPPIVFDDYEDLLEAFKNGIIKINLVVLATPSGLHSNQTIKAANLGINICTEKPMATTLEDGRKMLRACKEKNVELFVIKQNRFNKTLLAVKENIDRGLFGNIYMISSNVFWQRPQSYYDQDSWRGSAFMDGGALMNQASHFIDLLIWLNGKVKEVNSFSATLGRKIDVEDSAVLNFLFENGSLGSMAVTMLTYPKNMEGSITVLGEKGSVRIGGNALNKIEHWDIKDNRLDSDQIKKINFENKRGLGHKYCYQNIINYLNGLENISCNGEEGFNSLELLIAANLSAKNNKTISLPYDDF